MKEYSGDLQAIYEEDKRHLEEVVENASIESQTGVIMAKAMDGGSFMEICGLGSELTGGTGLQIFGVRTALDITKP